MRSARRQSSNRTGRGGNKRGGGGPGHAHPPPPPLQELRAALDRIDALVSQTVDAYRTERAGGDGSKGGSGAKTDGAAGANNPAGGGGVGRALGMRRLPGAGAVRPGSARRFGFGGVRARAAAGDGDGDNNNNGSNKDGEPKAANADDVLVSTEADETAIINQFMAEVSGELDEKAKRMAETEQEASAAEEKERDKDKEDPPSSSSAAANEKKNVRRQRARRKRKPLQPQTARFMPFDSGDDAELVELLRRTAELVVQGERAAAAALGRAEKMGANVANGDDQQQEEEDPMAEYDAHQAVFEYFCEREGLRTIVRLTTGDAFQAATATATAATDKDDSDTASSSTAVSYTHLTLPTILRV